MHQLIFTLCLGLFQPGLKNLLFSSSTEKVLVCPKATETGKLRREGDADFLIYMPLQNVTKAHLVLHYNSLQIVSF